jgi:ribosomal protein S27AE
MRKKKQPWQPYETECKHCGKLGIKANPRQKYLHEKCIKIRHKIVIKRSIITIKLKRTKETQEYLNKVNRHIIKKKRECLRCGHEFMSEGNHNRLCNRCITMIDKKVVFIVRIYKNPKIR